MGMILFRLLACARNSEVGMDLYDSPSIFHDFPSRWYTPTLIKFKFKSSPQMLKPEVLVGCQYSWSWSYRTKAGQTRKDTHTQIKRTTHHTMRDTPSWSSTYLMSIYGFFFSGALQGCVVVRPRDTLLTSQINLIVLLLLAPSCVPTCKLFNSNFSHKSVIFGDTDSWLPVAW